MRFIKLIVWKLYLLNIDLRIQSAMRMIKVNRIFNIFELHVMTYYVTFMQLYNRIQGFDTVYEKTTHKFLLKIFFIMTNRINDWEIQILKYNVQQYNMTVMQNVIHYLKIRTRFKIKKQLDVKIIKICQDSMKLINFLNALNRVALCQLKRSQKHYRKAEKLVTIL